MNASRLRISVPPPGRSARFVRSAAGFIATSTSGRSPGVRMSWSEKWIWKPGHAGERARRRADLGREVRERGQVVAEGCGLAREPPARELHPVAGVSSEANDDVVDLLDLLGHPISGYSPEVERCASLARDLAAHVEELLRDVAEHDVPAAARAPPNAIRPSPQPTSSSQAAQGSRLNPRRRRARRRRAAR